MKGLLSRFQSRGPAAKGPAYRRSAFRSSYAGPELRLVRAEHGSLVVPEFVLDFVYQCERFESLEAHLSEFAAESGRDRLQIETVQKWVPALVEAGCLVALDRIVEAIGRELDLSRRVPAVTTLALTLSDGRPFPTEALHAFSMALEGRLMDFVVIDGTSDPDRRGQHRELARDFVRETRLPLFYAGWEETAAHVQAIVEEAECDEGAVALLLLGLRDLPGGPGRALNALLLDQGGRHFVVLAPDARPGLRELPDRYDEVVFSEDVSEVRCFAASTEEVALDVVSSHERFLGRAVAEILPGDGENLRGDFPGLSDVMCKRLLEGGRAIAVTSSGWAAPASDDAWSVSQPTLTPGPLRAGTSMGLNRYRVLPPLLPVLSNPWGLFGTMLRQTTGEWVALLPWAMEARAMESERREGIPAAMLMEHLIGGSVVSGGFQGLGGRLFGAAGATQAAFDDVLQEAAAACAGRQLAEAEAEGDDERCRRLRAILTDPELGTPGDLRKDRSPAEARASLRRLVRRFGRTLAAWPEIVAAADRLRARGVRLARRVLPK